jgi:hypothetical protein
VTNRVFLGVDGVFQAVGVLEILGGFIFPEDVQETKAVAKRQPLQLHVTPMRFGLGSYGVGAVGTF